MSTIAALAFESESLVLLASPPNKKSGSNRCACRRASTNKQCTNSVCVHCCAQRSTFCTVSTHRAARAKLNHSPTTDFIQEAMNQQQIIWITYSGGSQPGTSRPICPKAWSARNVSFLAADVRSGEEKKYLIDRITKYSADQH